MSSELPAWLSVGVLGVAALAMDVPPTAVRLLTSVARGVALEQGMDPVLVALCVGVASFDDRVMDVELENRDVSQTVCVNMLIRSAMSVPRLSVWLAAVFTGIEDMARHGWEASVAGSRLMAGDANRLDSEEAGALYLYTMETPLYWHMNRHLRNMDLESLRAFLPLLRLLLEAKQKLPAFAGTVFRGIRRDLVGNYRQGDEFVWSSFNSTSKRQDVARKFVGSGRGTLFSIRATARAGRDISRYSAFADKEDKEDEVLLFPGARLRVISAYDSGHVHQVELEEI